MAIAIGKRLIKGLLKRQAARRARFEERGFRRIGRGFEEGEKVGKKLLPRTAKKYGIAERGLERRLGKKKAAKKMGKAHDKLRVKMQDGDPGNVHDWVNWY